MEYIYKGILCVCYVTSGVSISLRPCGLIHQAPPLDSPGKSTGVGHQAQFQGVFLTQRLNSCLLTSPAFAGRVSTTSATWEVQWDITHSHIKEYYFVVCSNVDENNVKWKSHTEDGKRQQTSEYNKKRSKLTNIENKLVVNSEGEEGQYRSGGLGGTNYWV